MQSRHLSRTEEAASVPVTKLAQQQQQPYNAARGQPAQPAAAKQQAAWAADPLFDELSRFAPGIGGLLLGGQQQPRGFGGGFGGGGIGGDMARMFALMDNLVGRYPGFAPTYDNLSRAYGGLPQPQPQQQQQLGDVAAAAAQQALAPFGFGAPQQALALPAAFAGGLQTAMRMDVAEDATGYDVKVRVCVCEGRVRIPACARVCAPPPRLTPASNTPPPPPPPPPPPHTRTRRWTCPAWTRATSPSRWTTPRARCAWRRARAPRATTRPRAAA